VPPSYKPPVRAGLAPSSRPGRGANLTITGTNFGVPGFATVTMTLRTIPIKILWQSSNHTKMIVGVGKGQGRNNFTVSVGGFNGSYLIAYHAPILTQVRNSSGFGELKPIW
jgi:hypothetical protein